MLRTNERGDVTEFTIGNVVVDLGGRLVTPPVDCGLLEGVFRDTLVRSGAVTERVVTMDEARQAPRLWLVNSLREWVPVELVP